MKYRQGMVLPYCLHHKLISILFHKTNNPDLISILNNWGIFEEVRQISSKDLGENESDNSLYNNLNEPVMTIFLKEYSDLKPGYKLKIIYDRIINEKELWFGGHNVLFNTWVENNLLNSIREVIIRKR